MLFFVCYPLLLNYSDSFSQHFFNKNCYLNFPIIIRIFWQFKITVFFFLLLYLLNKWVYIFEHSISCYSNLYRLFNFLHTLLQLQYLQLRPLLLLIFNAIVKISVIDFKRSVGILTFDIPVQFWVWLRFSQLIMYKTLNFARFHCFSLLKISLDYFFNWSTKIFNILIFVRK